MIEELKKEEAQLIPINEWMGDWLVDITTGEILAHREAKPEFHVTDEKSAEWVLEKLHALDGETAGLQMRLQAVQEQIGAMVREKQNRRNWMQMRFGAELEEFARKQLEGKKSRSLKLLWGTLAFRTTNARIALREGVEAKQSLAKGSVLPRLPLISWALKNAPEAVKATEEFQISQLPEGMKVIGNLPEEFFQEVPVGENFSIKTGIGM